MTMYRDTESSSRIEVFAFNGNDQFVSAIPNGMKRCFHARRFRNQEWTIELDDPVQDQSCMIVGNIAPADEQLLLMSMLAHTLEHHGARTIEAVIPYMAYARQEHEEAKQSFGAHWAGHILRSSGIGRVYTFDIHSALAIESMGGSIVSILPAPTFARIIARELPGNVTIVAPDIGATSRCEAVRTALGRSEPIVHGHKARRDGMVSLELHGRSNEAAVIIDDILDSGSTLCACAMELQKLGAKSITAMVTHGLFSGNGWQRLWDLGVTRIFVANTSELSVPFDSRITLCDVAPLLTEAIAAAHSMPWMPSDRPAVQGNAGLPV